jgi:lysophospholipase L1-like esterase
MKKYSLIFISVLIFSFLSLPLLRPAYCQAQSSQDLAQRIENLKIHYKNLQAQTKKIGPAHKSADKRKLTAHQGLIKIQQEILRLEKMAAHIEALNTPDDAVITADTSNTPPPADTEPASPADTPVVTQVHTAADTPVVTQVHTAAGTPAVTPAIVNTPANFPADTPADTNDSSGPDNKIAISSDPGLLNALDMMDTDPSDNVKTTAARPAKTDVTPDNAVTPVKTPKALIKNVLALGDSITAHGGYIQKLKELAGPGIKFTKAATVGHKTSQMLARISDPSVAGYADISQFDTLILMGGVNNIWAGKSKITADIDKIISLASKKLKAPKKIVLLTILPFKGYPSWQKKSHQTILQVNEYLKSKDTGTNIICVDTFKLLADPGDNEKLMPGISSDKLHPNSKGQKEMGELIYKKVFK